MAGLGGHRANMTRLRSDPCGISAKPDAAIRVPSVDRPGKPGSLVDRPHRIELGGQARAADQLWLRAPGRERVGETVIRILPGAEYDRIGR